MFRPGRHAPQYRHGASGSPIQGHPGMINGARPFPHHVMHGRGILISPPPFPGSQQRPLGFAPSPGVPPHVSGFSPVSRPSAPNQVALFSAPHLGTMPSRPPLEPHHFPRPGCSPSGPPPHLPLPPRASFGVPLPLGSPTDAPPPPPSFSPLPLPPPPAVDFSQPTLSSPAPPLHLPLPPPTPTAEACQPPPPTAEVSQPTPPINDVLQSPRSSHLLRMHTSPQEPTDEDVVQNIELPTPPQRPNDEEMVQNIEILSQFVVENGPEFENMARVKQADNPKFSFLFDGTPGSDAAIGFQYFQWMKMKLDREMKMGREAEGGGQSAELLEPPKDSQQCTDPPFAPVVASTSPATIDMDVDDDCALTAPRQDGEDPQSHQASEIGFKSSDQDETGHLPSYLNSKAIGAEGGELIAANVTQMDTLQFDSQDKKEICQELAFEGPRVEDLSPVQSSLIELQPTTNIDKQAVENEGHKPSSSIEESHVNSNAVLGEDALPKNYEESLPTDLVCEHADDGMPQIPVFGGNSTGDSMTHDNVECEEKESIKPSHVSAELSEASDSSKGGDRIVSENNDVLREPDHEMFDGEVLAKKEEEEVESLTNEGASSSESDGVLYTRKERKKARSRSRSQSPRGSRLRDHSQTPGRRSRSRSPLRRGEIKCDEQGRGTRIARPCFYFARGMCRQGSSCIFVHPDTVDNAREWSSGGGGKGEGSNERVQDRKGYMGGVERSVVVEDASKNASLSRVPEGYGSPIPTEKKRQGVDLSDDSYSRRKVSPEWDAKGISEPRIPEKDIFRPPLPCREDFRSRPLPREEFRPLPLPRNEFRPLPLPSEEFRPPSFPREDFNPLPFRREDVRLQSLPREDLGPQFPFREDFRSPLFPREDVRSLSVIRKDIGTQPLFQEDMRTQTFLREDLHAHALRREDLDAQTLRQEDLHARALLRDSLRNQSMGRGSFHDQPVLRDELRVPSLVREELHPVRVGNNLLSQPLPRGDLRFPEEGLHSQSLLHDDLRFRHLLREDSRFRAEDLRSREDLHPKIFPREDTHLQPLGRDFPSRQLDSSMGRFDPVASGNPPIRQNSVLPVNSSLLSHVNFTNNLDPLRPGHPINSSLLDQSTKPPFLGGHAASSPHGSFSMNPKSVSQPGFPSSMQEPVFPANFSAGMPSAFAHHSLLHSTGTSEQFSLEHPSDGKQGFFTSRPLNMPPLSPPNISRIESQFLPKRVSSMPFEISGEWQSYRYSHSGEPSMPGPTSPHRHNEIHSAAGGQYDPLYDSIEPVSEGNEAFKYFEFGRGEDNHGNVTVRESETPPLLENANHGRDGANIATGRLSQPQNVPDNNRHKVEADYGVEAAMDAEVGVVDNESPGLEEGRDWTPGHRLEVATACAGEVDMDQIHPNDKTRNIKEIRVMKIFRTALAEFVKELLKPTWREGHMSKEAFKTIVKKAVDKVAGTLQSHQIPNTQERIDQYLASSRLKLTKLVEGYVDKYAKG